jgi:hypothetical protein
VLVGFLGPLEVGVSTVTDAHSGVRSDQTPQDDERDGCDEDQKAVGPPFRRRQHGLVHGERDENGGRYE